MDTEPEPRWFIGRPPTLTPLNTGDSDLIEVIFRTGGDHADIDGIKVDIKNRKAYKGKESFQVIRGTWFWQDEARNWHPLPEAYAKQIEEAYSNAMFGRTVTAPPAGPKYSFVLNANGTGRWRRVKEGVTFLIRRGYDGRTIKITRDERKSEPPVQYPEPIVSEIVSNIPIPPQEQSQSMYEQGGVEHSQHSSLENSLESVNSISSPQLSPSLESSKDRVIKEGYVSIKSQHSWKPRILYLTKDYLIAFNSGMKEKLRTSVRKITRVAILYPSPEFDVRTHSSTWHVRTETVQETEEWVNAILATMRGLTCSPSPVHSPQNNRVVTTETSQSSVVGSPKTSKCVDTLIDLDFSPSKNHLESTNGKSYIKPELTTLSSDYFSPTTAGTQTQTNNLLPQHIGEFSPASQGICVNMNTNLQPPPYLPPASQCYSPPYNPQPQAPAVIPSYGGYPVPAANYEAAAYTPAFAPFYSSNPSSPQFGMAGAIQY